MYMYKAQPKYCNNSRIHFRHYKYTTAEFLFLLLFFSNSSYIQFILFDKHTHTHTNQILFHRRAFKSFTYFLVAASTFLMRKNRPIIACLCAKRAIKYVQFVNQAHKSECEICALVPKMYAIYGCIIERTHTHTHTHNTRINIVNQPDKDI